LKDGGRGGTQRRHPHSVENVIAQTRRGYQVVCSSGCDTITGNGVNNVLNGLSGNEYLDGAGGADTLIGGLGVER